MDTSSNFFFYGDPMSTELNPTFSQFIVILLGKILEKHAPEIEKKLHYMQWPEIADVLNKEFSLELPKENPVAVDVIVSVCQALPSQY